MFEMFNSDYARQYLSPAVPEDPRMERALETALTSGNTALRQTDLGQVLARSEEFADDPAQALISRLGIGGEQDSRPWFGADSASNFTPRNLEMLIDDYAQRMGVSQEVAAAVMYEVFNADPGNPWGGANRDDTGSGFSRLMAGLRIGDFTRNTLENQFDFDAANELLRNYAGDDVSIQDAFARLNDGFGANEEYEQQARFAMNELRSLQSQQRRIAEARGEDSPEYAAITEQIQAMEEQIGQFMELIRNPDLR